MGHRTLLDNDTGFKNKLFPQVASTIGIKHVFSSPYYPEGSGHNANAQNFLKTYMQKHMSTELAWDEVVTIACATYNCILNEHSKDSAFFFMFGRDACMLLV